MTDIIKELVGVASDPVEIKSTEAFGNYWSAKDSAVLIDGQHNIVRLIGFDCWNAGRRYEQSLKEQKRNPIFQPKPGDVVGKGSEERSVNSVSEYKTSILVNYDGKGPGEVPVQGQCDLQKWQEWAKDADLIRRRKKS